MERRASLIRNVLIIYIKINMKNKLKLHYGDLTDYHIINPKVQPDEIYNLGAMSHVMVSLIHLNMLLM
jgi:GDPmannose 4,6-dehydratase